MLDLWHHFRSWLWGRKQTESKREEKKNRLNVWYVCAALSELPSIIGWTHTYTLKNTCIYITTASIQEEEYVEYSKNKHKKKKFRNTTTGNTSHTQVNGILGKTIASSSCDVTGHLETVWEFWYPSGIGQPHSAKEFLILFVDVCVLCRTKTLFCKRHWCCSRRSCLYPIMGGNESGQSHVDIVPGITADRLTAFGAVGRNWNNNR